jgi:hypothetical protein
MSIRLRKGEVVTFDFEFDHHPAGSEFVVQDLFEATQYEGNLNNPEFDTSLSHHQIVGFRPVLYTDKRALVETFDVGTNIAALRPRELKVYPPGA